MTRTRIARVACVAVIAALAAACSPNDPAKFLVSAESYAAKKNFPAAIIELKNALNVAPDDARARFLLGTSFLEVGDAAAAATELRKAIVLGYSPDDAYPLLARAVAQQSPSKSDIAELAKAPVKDPRAKAEVASMLGASYLTLGQSAEAREQIQAALALDPTNVNARVGKARLAIVEHDLPAAQQAIDAVLASAPDNVDALMLKSNLLIAARQEPEAVVTLERVVKLSPDVFRARYVLASMFVQARDNDKAAAQVEVLKKMAPGSPYTLHAIGIVAFAKGDTATALDATQKSLEIAPDYMPARYLSGLIDLKRGAYASAAQSFRTVVAKSPEDDGVRMALAETLLRQGRGAQAQEVLEPTLVRSPENETALRLAAEIQLAQKRPAEAADLLAKANALDGANVKGRVRLAEVRLAKGETSQGVRDLESLSASDPNAREPDIALVSAFLRARDYPKALAAAETIVKKQPSSPVGYNTVGAVYMVMGDFKAARQSLEKALSIDPGFLAAQYGLARLDTGERDFDGAKARYQKILDKLPNSEPALLGLAEILNATAAPSETTAAAIQRAVSANPSSVGARLALINYYASRKNFTVALTAAQAAQAAIPDNPAILDLLASVQQSAGETNQAIETYTRLSKLQPDNPGPLIRLARIQASQKNYEAAIAFLKSARIAAPDNPTVWSALAGTYYDATRADEGLAEARRLQKEMPAQAAGYVLEADILALQKKMPEAAAAYRAALVRQAPPLVVVRLYALLNAQNKGDEAAAVAQKWLADHPSDATVRAYLGQRKLESKDYKVAARYFREAVDIDPSNASMLNNLAWSLMETNDPKALDYAERAYRIAPGDAAVVNTYGSILVQRGDLAQGIRHLRRSVALDPADSALRLSLARALIKNGDKDGARKELEVVAKTKSAADKSEAEQLLKGI